jgi:hypothetical protein
MQSNSYKGTLTCSVLAGGAALCGATGRATRPTLPSLKSSPSPVLSTNHSAALISTRSAGQRHAVLPLS